MSATTKRGIDNGEKINEENSLPKSKRLREQQAEGDNKHEPSKRARSGSDRGDAKAAAEASTDKNLNYSENSERWRVHQMTEDYVDFASNLMLTPVSQLGSYGYDNSKQQYPLESLSALGYLKSLKRRPMVIERWSPLEVALFEAAMLQYGKEFHQVQKAIETKTTKEVIDFYYMWKKTSHYLKWKQQYDPPHLHDSEDDEKKR